MIVGVFLLLSTIVSLVESTTDHYYEMVEAILDVGPNYYEILGVESTATHREIKKAYRSLSVKFHPDKNDAPDAAEVYVNINKAFAILKDEETRQEFDDLLRYGVAWHDRYIGQHVHNFSRDADFKYVLLGFLVALSAIQYFSRVHYHHRMRASARKTTQYTAALKQYQKQCGISNNFLKKAEKNGEDIDEILNKCIEDFEKAINFNVSGAELPKWHELLIVQIFVWPYQTIRKWMKTTEQIELENAARHGMTLQEYRAALKKVVDEMRRKKLL